MEPKTAFFTLTLMGVVVCMLDFLGMGLFGIQSQGHLQIGYSLWHIVCKISSDKISMNKNQFH